MRALIAFDKFKDALTAREACDIAAEALSSCQPSWDIEIAPLADGGDGFCDTLTGPSDLDGSVVSIIAVSLTVDGLIGNGKSATPGRFGSPTARRRP